MTYGDPTRPSESDPDSPSTCIAQPYDSQSRDDEPSVSTSLTPELPLKAAINPIHRAFVPRLLPEHLEGHLHFPRALASSIGRLACTGFAKALCAAIMQKVEQFEVNRERGAARMWLRVPAFMLPPLPRNWEKMVDAVQESWEKGLNGSPALKTLVSGSTTRADMASKKQLFGWVSSSMLSKSGLIANDAAKSGGWSALRSVLRRERASRPRAVRSLSTTTCTSFLAALVSQSDLGC